MKAYKTKTWQQETMGMRGSVKLFGINPFDYEWRPAGKRGKINNAFGQTCSYAVNKINVGGFDYEFIAVEISNDIWEFYTFKF